MTTTLITGATSGIGYELARQYRQMGHRVLLVGRKPLSQLDQTFINADSYIQADLALPSATQTITAFLEQHGIQELDLLLHNAGTGYFGEIAAQSSNSIQTVIDVNLSAPVMLTHALLPHLKQAHGKIILISSVVANLPASDYAVYAASKAALDEFGDNLRIELKNDGVSVQVIHPGATQTEMHSKLGIPSERMDTSKFPTADSVAQQIIRVIQTNKSQSTIGLSNKLMRFAGKHAAGLIDFVMKRSKA